jgi:hypothetical protein
MTSKEQGMAVVIDFGGDSNTKLWKNLVQPGSNYTNYLFDMSSFLAPNTTYVVIFGVNELGLVNMFGSPGILTNVPATQQFTTGSIGQVTSTLESVLSNPTLPVTATIHAL